MENFYTNFIVFNATQDSALAVMRELRREGYVAPSISGMVTIYDAASDEQNTDVIECLGAGLSERLQLPVLAVLNHDDDHLLFWLFRDGRQVLQIVIWCRSNHVFERMDMKTDGSILYPDLTLE